MLHVKTVEGILESVKEQLEPLRSALFDDGLDTYSDDLQDAIERIDLLLEVLSKEKTFA